MLPQSSNIHILPRMTGGEAFLSSRATMKALIEAALAIDPVNRTCQAERHKAVEAIVDHGLSGFPQPKVMQGCVFDPIEVDAIAALRGDAIEAIEDVSDHLVLYAAIRVLIYGRDYRINAQKCQGWSEFCDQYGAAILWAPARATPEVPRAWIVKRERGPSLRLNEAASRIVRNAGGSARVDLMGNATLQVTPGSAPGAIVARPAHPAFASLSDLELGIGAGALAVMALHNVVADLCWSSAGTLVWND